MDPSYDQESGLKTEWPAGPHHRRSPRHCGCLLTFLLIPTLDKVPLGHGLQPFSLDSRHLGRSPPWRTMSLGRACCTFSAPGLVAEHTHCCRLPWRCTVGWRRRPLSSSTRKCTAPMECLEHPPSVVSVSHFMFVPLFVQ
jgi:hypothetical protein